jgi:uncharacterized membrane protein YgcG
VSETDTRLSSDLCLSVSLPYPCCCSHHRRPPWGDPLLHTWHSVLGLRLALPAATVLLPLLSLLEAQAVAQQKSQKYCNVLFALVSKYGPQLAAADNSSSSGGAGGRQQRSGDDPPPPGTTEGGGGGGGGGSSLEVLERLLNGCTSFVRKPALTALAKLKKTLAATAS